MLARSSPGIQPINLKNAQKAARQNKGYLHKCAVCGRTNTDNPDLEFRCCMNHINNHVHIQ